MKGTCTLFILLHFLFPSRAQITGPFVINVTGNSAITGLYRFDWSVGELCLIDSWTNTRGTLENGFLHPGTERKTDSIDFLAKGDIMIWPNPVYTTADINFTLTTPGLVQMKIFDVLGRLIMKKEFSYNGAGHIEKVNMEQYRSGTYFLHLTLTPLDTGLSQRKGIYKITLLTK
jgi:hypothetical protein